MSSQPWIERAIAFLSPGWAARRAYGRAILEASHRGGVSTRVSIPWTQSQSIKFGSKAERINLASRRDRARRVYQEHPVGRSLLKTETDNVVGDGITLQAKTASKDFNREAEEKWEQWLEVADIRRMENGSDLMRRSYRSPRRDGDGGLVLVDRGGESRLQYIPGDLICNPMSTADDLTLVDGVEVDSASRPVAFHILDNSEYARPEWTRVPASNFVYFVPEFDEDLGVRGATCYSQIFELLDGLDGYVDAVVIAARMAAVFGLIFKDDNSAKQLGTLPQLTNSQGQQQRAVTLENGSIKYVGQKGDVVQVQAQQPMTQTPDFIRAVCRLIGLPFDMPLELVLKDVSQVNFSSARVGLLGYYRACRARQKPFRAKWDRIYQWWISREQKKQALGFDGAFISAFPSDYWAHRFIFQGWDYTDPVSEAQADLLQMDMGVKTPQMVAAERGRDWEEMQEDLAVARATRRLKELADVGSSLTRDRVEAETQPAPSPEPTKDEADQQFRQDVLKQLLAVPAAREAVANRIDVGGLVGATGLPQRTDYKPPMIPVVASTGPLVSGALIYGPDGQLVGGDVENEAPADLTPAGTQGAGPDGNGDGEGEEPADGGEEPKGEPAGAGK